MNGLPMKKARFDAELDIANKEFRESAVYKSLFDGQARLIKNDG